MSAFVIDDKTMARCVRTICAYGQCGPIVRGGFACIDTRADDAMTRIGRKLFAMNIVAVEERYPDCRSDKSGMPGPCDEDGNSTAMAVAAAFTLPAGTRRAPMRLAALCDGYKALRCLRYQCSEGDIPMTDLFAELERAMGEIAEEIVQGLPEYEAASWG